MYDYPISRETLEDIRQRLLPAALSAEALRLARKEVFALEERVTRHFSEIYRRLEQLEKKGED